MWLKTLNRGYLSMAISIPFQFKIIWKIKKKFQLHKVMQILDKYYQIPII